MSDLSERMRRIATTPSAYVQSISRDELIEAADRLDELEVALRVIARGKHVDPFGNILDQPSREANIARRALEAER